MGSFSHTARWWQKGEAADERVSPPVWHLSHLLILFDEDSPLPNTDQPRHINRCCAPTPKVKDKWVENREFSKMVWFLADLLLPFVELNLTSWDWGIFFLLFLVLQCTLSCFLAEVLVAGGLASGQHAHNPPTKLISSLHLSGPMVIISKCLQIW